MIYEIKNEMPNTMFFDFIGLILHCSDGMTISQAGKQFNQYLWECDMLMEQELSDY